MNLVQLLFGEVTYRERISHTREVNCLIKDHGIFPGYTAGNENAAVPITAGFTYLELLGLETIGRFIATKCFMGVFRSELGDLDDLFGFMILDLYRWGWDLRELSGMA